MNIEIKFRAKNKIGWIYGYLSYANILNKKVMCIYDGNGDCIVDIDTIGQFLDCMTRMEMIFTRVTLFNFNVRKTNIIVLLTGI